MAFDDATRGQLQKFVGDARTLLTTEFTNQFQQEYGLDPESGDVASLDTLTLDDQRLETARILRQIFDHYLASAIGSSVEVRKSVLGRMVREQAFTTLNRLAALCMMEARGLVMECVAKGYQSKAFQLYQRVAGSALGETGDAYRVFLLSLCDLYSDDLPALFDRHYPNGRLFPREPALLPLLDLVNAADIEPLWGEDETIGWIYQYFNSKEERKAMREASQAPRNSRELAVRNQFFTPRYVVEFLVDNTLGRQWFNWTGGQTGLRDRCQYLLVKPDENPEPAARLRDPRTIKLLDPACGSMHFGLYAFDLFLDIYREAWAWEQEHGPGVLDVSTQPLANFKPLCHSYVDEDTFLRDVPRLIIEHNVHGVDIDPRAAQIASLALWLRAQRAWHEAGVRAGDRPLVGRGQVVAAVAPPAEPDLRRSFMQELDPLDAELFEKTLLMLKGLPELGILLQVEKELPRLTEQVYGKVFDLLRERARRKGWAQIETDLRGALAGFAQAARATYQGRLFSLDALQGLRLIDLSREVFDVIVMNPPFGALSKGAKDELERSYPISSNDLLAVFVDRGLGLLRRGGHLGAVTSRTCFFLTSFKDWRKQIVLARSGIEVIADLGQGVMDDAMVEAAAYVLVRDVRKTVSMSIRAIADDDRSHALEVCVGTHRAGGADDRIFLTEAKSFDLLPGSPFVYWTSSDTIARFSSDKSFEPDVGTVRVGLQTGDDPRFVRAVWEVRPSDTILCYYPTDGSEFCRFDDPIVEEYLRRRDIGRHTWAFHVKAGASQPWHSPITLKVNWRNDGRELRNFTNGEGKLRSRPQNIGFYYRPGFSWTRRAVRFYPYAIPGNCIPSVSRYMAYPDQGMHIEALGVVASRMASAFMRFYGEKFEFPNFLVEGLKILPWPQLDKKAVNYFGSLINREVENRRMAYQNFEPFHEFLIPTKVCDLSVGGKKLAFDPLSLLGEIGEQMVAEAYGFSSEQATSVERDLREALDYRRRKPAPNVTGDEDDSDDKDFVLDTSEYATEEAHISYLVGCAFGRWDIRYAISAHPPSFSRDPFAPLPACPPGMLQNERGLPIQYGELDNSYPLDIEWSGVLTDDEGNPSDIVEHVRRAAAVIWGAEAGRIEDDACQVLGVGSLRDYFRRSSKFFADHIARYTKSSRRAPIYWSLSTTSGSYTLWVYYPSLTSQTLYTAVNDFIEPKLKQVGQEANALRTKASARSREEDRALEALQSLEQELIGLRDMMLQIAPTYRPNQDDGVQIAAAPLWPLFRHKPWQNLLKETWGKLEKGEYDWAHLAMAYWPDRVREKCKTDKSLAIAHDLEHLYVEPPPAPSKSRGRKKGG